MMLISVFPGEYRGFVVITRNEVYRAPHILTTAPEQALEGIKIRR